LVARIGSRWGLPVFFLGKEETVKHAMQQPQQQPTSTQIQLVQRHDADHLLGGAASELAKALGTLFALKANLARMAEVITGGRLAVRAATLGKLPPGFEGVADELDADRMRAAVRAIDTVIENTGSAVLVCQAPRPADKAAVQ
jgi:hypothetical protein